ncbi:MAG TPA: sulfatase [Spongiibacteraceae bacterium]
MKKYFALVVFIVLAECIGCAPKAVPIGSVARPNFLLVLTDDQSWVHTGFAGDPTVKTPSFDAIARSGIYFKQAYTAAPTCTASRSALFSGQAMWRTGEGAVLWGRYPADLPSYQAILAQHGYLVGFTGKGWGPGQNLMPLPNPAGHPYQHRGQQHPGSISKIDHVQSFIDFLGDLKPGQPFSFVVTPTEPHRPYPEGAAKKHGLAVDTVNVPGFLPNTATVKEDIANYLYAIESQDQMLGEILDVLRKYQMLENTIVIVTSDNGMPFPRAKSNLYEYGVRVPLALQWPRKIAAGQQRDALVDLTDLAPTFLDLAGVAIPSSFTGHSLHALFNEDVKAAEWSAVFTGFERHIKTARPGNQTYPMRAVHTARYVYIRNFRPELWPAGDPPRYLDIDEESPTKLELLADDPTPAIVTALQLATKKRNADELYDIVQDPFELHNLAGDARYDKVLQQLKMRLSDELRRTEDPLLKKGVAAFAIYQ